MVASPVVNRMVQLSDRARACASAHLMQKHFIPPRAVTPWDVANVPSRNSTAVDEHYWGVIRILEEVRHASGFSTHDLNSRRRTYDLVRARHIACWLVRSSTRLSLPEIGRFLGGRDHTTIIHACRRVDDLIAFHGIKVVNEPGRMARRLWAADWRAVP